MSNHHLAQPLINQNVGEIDLRHIVKHMSTHTPDHTIASFEKGKPVKRTFETLVNDVINTRSQLIKWGVKAGMRVGIRSPNCYEWIVYDLALIDICAITVAFTDDFAQLEPEKLCEKYQLSLFLAGTKELKCHWAKHYIAYFKHDNVDVRVIERSPDSDPDFHRPGLIFSSGSSGGIKGLILNRRGIETCIDAFAKAVAPNQNDRLMLFLPLANFQQRLMYYAAFWYGFNLIVIEPTRLFQGLLEFAPTIFIAPPALFEAIETRFYSLPKVKKIAAMTVGHLAKYIPFPTMRKKCARSIFQKAYELLGGEIRFMVTGMAPIKRTTLELFELMQLPLFETYGLIESGSVALNLPGATKIGSVGKILDGVNVDFTPEGEILVQRLHPICVSYFECATGENEQTFLDDRTIATGDIGFIDTNGYLYLTGRKKEMIITKGGEKVHPEVIEAELYKCPEIECVVVTGAQTSLRLIAIVRTRHTHNTKAKERIKRFIDERNANWSNINIGNVIFTDIVFSRENRFLRPQP